MTLSKTLSTLSLAGALIAAAVVFNPSNADAATKRCKVTKSGKVVCVIFR